MTQIIVLGAGVVGLTTAIELKKWNPNLNITIVAQHFPGDFDNQFYTSPYAGANWQSFASNEDINLQNLDKPSYKKFIQLAKNDPERSGIWIKDNITYYTNYKISETKGNMSEFIPWYRNFVEDFKIIDEDKIKFKDIGFGTSFKGVVISVPIYLNYLIQQNKELGNKFKKAKIDNIDELKNFNGIKTDYVINSAGLQATKIKGITDKKLTFPVKGQTLLVKNNTKSVLAVEGFPGTSDEMLYIMPRKEGGSIIGGCFKPGDNSSKIDEELTSRLIRRAINYSPEIIDPKYKNNPSKIEIIKTNIGFRPFREDGVRIEKDPKYNWLIHNYGAGGGGYQGSFGFAQKVVDILKNELSKSKSKSKL
ncbi:DAO1 [Candida pseudojiufengensis]|uniref:DAO1 n=1 Tax=Candida pseudojiufengensis TaxID=497109 RepID=UPI0022245AF3|nr:DAO1 [Candida pseudojiufengensis]KAI5966242.1 DAO1 [Candida pseudojiufengensis]